MGNCVVSDKKESLKDRKSLLQQQRISTTQRTEIPKRMGGAREHTISTLLDLDTIPSICEAPLYRCCLIVENFIELNESNDNNLLFLNYFDTIVFEKPDPRLTRKQFLDCIYNYSGAFASIKKVQFGQNWDNDPFNKEIGKTIGFLYIVTKATIEWPNYDDSKNSLNFLRSTPNLRGDFKNDIESDVIDDSELKRFEIFSRRVIGSENYNLDNDTFARIKQQLNASLQTEEICEDTVMWYGIFFWMNKLVTNKGIVRGGCLLYQNDDKFDESTKYQSVDELLELWQTIADEKKLSTKRHILDFRHCTLTTGEMNGQAYTKFSFSYDEGGCNIRLEKAVITINESYFNQSKRSSRYPVYISTYALAWILLREKAHIKLRVDTNSWRKTSEENCLLGFDHSGNIQVCLDKWVTPFHLNKWKKYIKTLYFKENIDDEDLSLWNFVEIEEIKQNETNPKMHGNAYSKNGKIHQIPQTILKQMRKN